MSASRCYLSLPAPAAGSWLPTASLTPSSSPALLSLPKLLFLSWTRLFPDSSHLLRDAGSVFSKTGSTTVNRSTKQTHAVYLRSAKLLFNESPFTITKWAVSLLKQVPDHGWYWPKGSIGGRTPEMHKLCTTYGNRHQTQNQQQVSQLIQVSMQSSYLQE